MNPFKSHYGRLFADRETIDQAMDYANRLINSISDGQDKVAAMTALMVLVNTASKLWPEASESEAFPLGAQVQALAERVAELELRPVTPEALGRGIEAWMEENFNERADTWLNDHADLDHEIERWMENNQDIENAVQDVLRNASLRLDF